MDPISIKTRYSADIADDRISQLPDELLITILSSTLTMKEAIATSILSKRWKSLWTYFYGFLDFDAEYESRLQKTFLDSEYIHRGVFDSKYILFDECTSKYIDYVNKVLNSHQGFGVPINKLRICWRLGNESKTVIDSWIYFVMKNRVQHIEFDLLEFISRTKYKLSLETLMGTTGIGFPNLSVLRLSFVDLTDEALAYLLSSDNCPLLQHISVKSACSLEYVKVVGNLKLKSLEFAHCWHIKDVEISSALTMVSFGFIGSKDTKITFENVPLLTEASFGGDYGQYVARIPNAQQLWSIFSQLEILRLDFFSRANYDYFELTSGLSIIEGVTSQFPKFDRVKSLEVLAYTPRAEDLNICVMAMIYGCPRLQKISLKMIYQYDKDSDSDSDSYSDSDGDENGILRGFGHQHKYLQAVEYKGWDGNKDDLELITDLLNISVLLDKVTIDPRTKFLSKEHELQVTSKKRNFQIHDKKREEGARKAAEKLRTILPHKVSLVLL